MQPNLSIHQKQDTEYEYANLLYSNHFLKGPEIRTCGNKIFTIQRFANNKTHGCCFRCNNYKCRKYYPIVINSFFSRSSYQPLTLIMEIIKCFISFEYNSQKAYTVIALLMSYNFFEIFQ